MLALPTPSSKELNTEKVNRLIMRTEQNTHAARSYYSVRMETHGAKRTKKKVMFLGFTRNKSPPHAQRPEGLCGTTYA